MASLMARYGSQLALAQTGGLAPMTGGSMTSRGS